MLGVVMPVFWGALWDKAPKWVVLWRRWVSSAAPFAAFGCTRSRRAGTAHGGCRLTCLLGLFYQRLQVSVAIAQFGMVGKACGGFTTVSFTVDRRKHMIGMVVTWGVPLIVAGAKDEYMGIMRVQMTVLMPHAIATLAGIVLHCRYTSGCIPPAGAHRSLPLDEAKAAAADASPSNRYGLELRIPGGWRSPSACGAPRRRHAARVPLDPRAAARQHGEAAALEPGPCPASPDPPCPARPGPASRRWQGLSTIAAGARCATTTHGRSVRCRCSPCSPRTSASADARLQPAAHVRRRRRPLLAPLAAGARRAARARRGAARRGAAGGLQRGAAAGLDDGALHADHPARADAAQHAQARIGVRIGRVRLHRGTGKGPRPPYYFLLVEAALPSFLPSFLACGGSTATALLTASTHCLTAPLLQITIALLLGAVRTFSGFMGAMVLCCGSGVAVALRSRCCRTPATCPPRARCRRSCAASTENRPQRLHKRRP